MSDGGKLFLFGGARLTWEGYEFLDAANNDIIWNKAKDTVKSKGMSLPFHIFRKLLESLIDSELFPS